MGKLKQKRRRLSTNLNDVNSIGIQNPALTRATNSSLSIRDFDKKKKRKYIIFLIITSHI